ncbi:MAG: HD domain-containing protein [Patescibacteria group bacterium]|jgi:(p)ppGpp synthase/HD superfamily hydrolase
MKYTEKIHRAIKFAAKTHQHYQDQKRKGKDIPYITHPLTVALILALHEADEDVICAGILHDTIEDSSEDKKVTAEMLTERFGKNVSDLVVSVTDNKQLKKEERKAEVLERLKTFSHDSIMLKSADVLNNIAEILDDHGRYGDITFKRFSESKEKTIEKYLKIISVLVGRWPESPLKDELEALASELKKL